MVRVLGKDAEIESLFEGAESVVERRKHDVMRVLDICSVVYSLKLDDLHNHCYVSDISSCANINCEDMIVCL